MERHEEEMKNFNEQHRVIVDELEARLENKEAEMGEERRQLEEKIGELEAETKGLQENMLKDSDYRLQVMV